MPLYNRIIANLCNGIFTTRYEMSVGDEYSDQLNNVLISVLLDCPELFYAGQEVQTEYRDGYVIVNFPNNYPDSDFNELNDELTAVVKKIAGDASQIDDEFERIMFVNNYLSTTIEPQFELNDINGNAYGALVKKVARCEGYVKAAKLIFDELGIESIICTGEVEHDGSMIAHAWIAVKYQDKFYAFDIAWDGGMAVNDIPGVVYTFMNKEYISVEHKTNYNYPITDDDQYLFWKLHNGDAEYLSDLQNADLIAAGSGYYSVHHLIDIELSEYEEDNELMEWIRDELSPLSIASRFTYAYRPDIHVFMVFYYNE